jgi:hypothetical protein
MIISGNTLVTISTVLGSQRLIHVADCTITKLNHDSTINRSVFHSLKCIDPTICSRMILILLPPLPCIKHLYNVIIIIVFFFLFLLCYKFIISKNLLNNEGIGFGDSLLPARLKTWFSFNPKGFEFILGLLCYFLQEFG